MKKLRTILSVGLLGLLAACGTSKTSTEADNNPMTNRGSSSASVLSGGNTVSSRTTTTENRTTRTTNGNVEVENKAGMEQMYSYVNMTGDQISRFERGWKSTTDAWKKTNPNQTMNSFERTEAQDKILKNILDDAQFASYQEWAKKNAE